ncbi:squalene/phytoene synthase family protein [Sneathiella marina]|uniref:Squalene/phytoene synthase family protein n=1 Tax=Sneathiella marina TaxID=2950108 RepID=A0ABY4W1X1_9PROT|nr:squalene/phytoene synthase family protein [Sneathiella marina]USG59867.1 squalene/phytoene synthase family protein [Sneathiella marina]
MTELKDAPFLAKEAKKFDYDRWLVSLFAPLPSRSSIHALLAFNGEISKVRETVSEVLLGDIRFQWWRDALRNLEDEKFSNHPILQSLKIIVSEHGLDVALLEEIIDARSKDLDPCPFTTSSELLDYAMGTGGLLSGLIYRAMGNAEEAGYKAAQQVGRAFALTGIIRAIPYHASQDLLLIPQELLKNHNLLPESVFREENCRAFYDVVKDLYVMAEKEHLDAMQAVLHRPKSEKPSYSLLVLNNLYLSRIRKSGFDPAHRLLEIGPVRKIFALLTK